MSKKLFEVESPSGMLFGIASVLGLVFTIFYTIASITIGNFDLSALFIIVSLGVVNGILATICIILTRNSNDFIKEKSDSNASLYEMKYRIEALERELIVEKHKLGDVSYLIHNIHDQLRDRMLELSSFYEELLEQKDLVPCDADIIDILRITKAFNIYLVNNIKEIFDQITKDNCSVCLKLINIDEETDDFVVSTLIRDTKSFRERKAKDSLANAPFPCHENTAFKVILSLEDDDSYYVCDDLKNEQTYINLNKNWNKYYNATLVAPIRLDLNGEMYEEGVDFSVLGFVCIDNMNGRFNQRASIEIIASIADSMYHYFDTTAKLLELSIMRVQENKKKAGK